MTVHGFEGSNHKGLPLQVREDVERLSVGDLNFERPAALQATEPPEVRGVGRDDVRLLVSTPKGHTHAHFTRLAEVLRAGDLLVVNDSAVLPASLPATSATGAFTLNLSTRYAPDLWLAEPRVSSSLPGPLPLQAGDAVEIAGVPARLVAPHLGLPRLWFIKVLGKLEPAMQAYGSPIRYGYVEHTYPLETYQTLFATRPGSAEMPSAARPFSRRVLERLETKGVELAPVTLHAGVSSLEVESEALEEHTLYAEPFAVSEKAARTINRARQEGRRVIAVGTTVVRALESAWNGAEVMPRQGFTGRFIRPGHCACILDGLITGFHDPEASHLAMLYAVAGRELVREGYLEAVREKYLWHEFGDSHLLLDIGDSKQRG